MKKKSVLVDGLIGLVLTLAVAFSYLIEAGWIERFELRAYDMRSTLRQSIDPAGEDIAIIAIDDDSLARIGRWPWPRTKIAELLEKVSAAKPKIIGLNILFSEPGLPQGFQEVQDLQTKYLELVKTKQVVEKKGVTFAGEFTAAQARMDFDARLRDALAKTGNVILPMAFDSGGTVGAKPEALPPAISSSALSVQVSRASAEAALSMIERNKATYPLVSFAEVVQGVGHVNIDQDFDGIVRREYPVIKYGDEYYPSYALQLVIRFLGFEAHEATVTPGKQIQVGKNVIPLGPGESMLVTFAGPARSFRYYPFHEVMNDKIQTDVFKDKIVIVGLSATGIATLYSTPVAYNLPNIEYVANVIKNIMNGEFLVRPEWAFNAEMGLIGFFGLILMLVLPRLRALPSAILTVFLLLGAVGGGTFAFVKHDYWVKIMYPVVLLAGGYVILTTKRFLVTEKGKELVEASAIETNKMLGLSFQGQGMLDLAFDKFRLCPLDDQLKDLLYNLGLDFERKRQYNKAVAVYEHVAKKDPAYKDIQEKIKMLSAAAQGAVFGGIGGGAKEGTVLISGGASKPTLGRYEIEKELGRGAMGIVYLGKDPKINRQVAIKTMMMDEGTDPASVKETKERFFREAESAGTLNHPNIVRIFDAGEENDICYIAMELLEGHDFTKYTVKESLLPLEQAVEHVAKVAEALDYAHQQGIVHRDIKPANFMLLKDGSIRVADFGIARITASSKTATGTVMGTPSYMSPEQVAGKKVDGRSDLFSLGVALFELVCGEKPFKGGEGIGTLLFQIANDPEPEPTQVNPNVPPAVSAVIHKALKKNPDERFARGNDFAAALRASLQAVKTAPNANVTQPLVAEPIAIPEPALPAPVVPAPGAPQIKLSAAPAETAPAPVPAKEKTLADRTAEEIAASITLVAAAPSPAPAPAQAAPSGAPAAAPEPASAALNPDATLPAGGISPLIEKPRPVVDATLRIEPKKPS